MSYYYWMKRNNNEYLISLYFKESVGWDWAQWTCSPAPEDSEGLNIIWTSALSICQWLWGPRSVCCCVKCIVYKTRLLFQKCYRLRGKALGTGRPTVMFFFFLKTIFMKGFGLGKRTDRLASAHRVLGHRWCAVSISDSTELVLLVLSVVLYTRSSLLWFVK